jgi:FkbM family methyltransferase
MFEHGEACNFIQVGAFDGLTADPLYRYIERCGWQGVMLEPQPGLAAKLRQLYKDNPNIIILEAAVDSERTTRTLYTVDSDTFPKWAAGLASFDREHILRHDWVLPGIEKFIREVHVSCIPFGEIIEVRPSGYGLDVLQIDAEGADGRILSLFPFNRLRPAIVHWEIKNMTRRSRNPRWTSFVHMDTSFRGRVTKTCSQ